ncbi:restriction endonuclease subunit S [SAR92 clade bacterium H455]|uniref:Restriction endonuclease subunit S n=1 Tax=SAR92 clade bacterium H455 TaxID=2974818 RepID=A0ABY5TM10_9GAMM|nr:restriction endonuclease subunit S [SAR92 clade bacterium H455]
MSSRVPEGWVRIDLEEGVSALISGQSPNRKENRATGDAFGILKTTAIDWGRFDEKQNQEVLDDYEPNNKHLVLENDILITKAGPTHRVGVVAQARNLRSNVLLSGKMTALRVNDRFTPDFLTYALCQEEAQNHLKANTTGMASSQTNFTHDALLRVPILSPPLPEQKKIASILTSVDEVIENTQKQIDKLQDLKKATMNELLTSGIGHTEFKDSELGRIPKSWDVKTVGELYEETKHLTSDSNEMPLFSLTMKHGLVSKPDRYIRDFLITDTSKDNYKSVRKGELVMNPMNLRWGAISAHYGKFDVCVSKYYNVLRGRDDQTSTLFYEALFQSKRFLNMYEKIAIGTLEEKKRVHWSDFQNIKVPVPPMQEQQRMETVIEHFLANVSRVMDRNSKYKSLKKSLMQDLLTGKVRVTVN